MDHWEIAADISSRAYASLQCSSGAQPQRGTDTIAIAKREDLELIPELKNSEIKEGCRVGREDANNTQYSEYAELQSSAAAPSAQLANTPQHSNHSSYVVGGDDDCRTWLGFRGQWYARCHLLKKTKNANTK